ncbi:MAG: sigma-70 family RNA polymerase sigma factor [Deltaproteobacteria bacterium]|nr:sigma-70 family RNA polymerase sigma factor [Deltaproteobacteria bacterium]
MDAKTTASLDVRDLYERYGRAVYRRCQYFLKNDAGAEDAMHDVFVKLVERQHEFRAEASPLTWMIRITTNHCLNLIRGSRAKWRERYEMTVKVDQALPRPAGATTLERRQLVLSVVGKADARAVAAAVYYFVDEMSQEEAAAAALCSVPTLRKRLRQFIQTARRELKRLDADLVFGEAPL